MDDMEDFDFYNKYYITVDEQGRITDGWSNGPHPEKSIDGAVLLNAKGSYQFRLYPNGEENPSLWTMEGIPLYKWVGGAVQERTVEEIQADIAQIPPPPPSPFEVLRADTDFCLAMIGGV